MQPPCYHANPVIVTSSCVHRVCAGVAEQFAIAEAKLRAWSSVDGDESNDDSYDEDFLPASEPATQSTGTPPSRLPLFVPLPQFPCSCLCGSMLCCRSNITSFAAEAASVSALCVSGLERHPAPQLSSLLHSCTIIPAVLQQTSYSSLLLAASCRLMMINEDLESLS